MRYLYITLAYVIGFFIAQLVKMPTPSGTFLLGCLPVGFMLYIYGKQTQASDIFLREANEQLRRQTLNTVIQRYMVAEYLGEKYPTVREAVRMATGQLFIIRDGKYETITPMQFETFTENYVKEFVTK